jgi:putative ABC transport system ATP-binding protein
MSIIKLNDVCLSLPGPSHGIVDIIHNASLEVNQGEIVSIVGPSGSGKTSMLMLIAGVEKATSGAIIIDGNDITSKDEDQLAKFRRDYVGVVFQNFHLIPTMTALENVKVALELANHDNADEDAKQALDSVGLSDRYDHYPEQLSGGEQQRVALARAFVTKPKILLADEPTGNLDSENGQNIIDLLFQMQEKHGTTLLLITHDKSLAEKASRKITIKDGYLSEE